MHEQSPSIGVLASCLFGFCLHASPARAGGTLTTTYMFTGGTDGAVPVGQLVFDPSGNGYGVTQAGAANGSCTASGCGTVYQISAAGQLTTLVTFTGANGASPAGGLVLQGTTLFGTTYFGGSANQGVVFSVNTDGTNFKLLHQFLGQDGANPTGAMVPVPGADAFYGTASLGGPHGQGILFRITQHGTYYPLHSFLGKDGEYPNQIAVDPAGDVIGSTYFGGGGCGFLAGYTLSGCGTVFSFVPATKVFTVLYQFTGKSDGAGPTLGSVGATGVIYGAADYDGRAGQGTVFSLAPAGASYAFTTLHTFANGQGYGPFSGPALMPDGDLVGEAGNILYTIQPSQPPAFKVLYDFAPDTVAANAEPAVNANGSIFGSSAFGGIAPCIASTGQLINTDGCGFNFTYVPAPQTDRLSPGRRASP